MGRKAQIPFYGTETPEINESVLTLYSRRKAQIPFYGTEKREARGKREKTDVSQSPNPVLRD